MIDDRLQSTFPDAALYATRQNRTIENAKNPVQPIATITAPQAIGLCDDLSLDAGASSGSGGRDFVYNWTLIGKGGGATHANTRNISKVLSTASSSAAGLVVLQRSFLPEKAKLTFSLTITNFLGQTGATALTIKKSGQPAPIAYIQGANPRVTTHSSDLVLRLSAWQPQLCDGITLSSPTMVFDWGEATGRFVKLGGSLSTINPRTLTIPANQLAANQKYAFEAFVSMESDPHINTTTTVDVVVESQPIAAAISGGHTREVPEISFGAIAVLPRGVFVRLLNCFQPHIFTPFLVFRLHSSFPFHPHRSVPIWRSRSVQRLRRTPTTRTHLGTFRGRA